MAPPATLSRSSRVYRVAALVETSNIYGREILRGIADFVRTATPAVQWSIYTEQHELGALPPAWLLRQTWDGILSRPTNAALARAFRKLGVPVVDLNDLHPDLGFPRLQSDNAAIGRLAADHLRERGFSHFAYCGFSGEPWAAARRDGFIAALASRGVTITRFETPWRGARVLPWQTEQRRLARWLLTLPKPVAIFTSNDVRGRHVQEACRRAALRIPDDVAVLGVDNDELFCGLTDPPLSSVQPDAHRLGLEAASKLSDWMEHKRKPPALALIPPRRVVTRQSTDILAIANADLAAALRHIHLHATEGLTVGHLLKQVAISRSTLDRLFQSHLGRSPRAEIRRLQLEQAAKLLTETSLPLKQIARDAGVRSVEYLSYLFRRQFKTTPGAYRKRRLP